MQCLLLLESWKYKLISSCIIDRWLMMHKSTFVTCTYSFVILIHSLAMLTSVYCKTVDICGTCKTVDICGTFGLPLLYCIYHHQQTHYCTCIMCFCQAELFHCAFTIELMQSVARCFTDELHIRVCAWMNARVWLLCLLHTLHVCALACLCVHIYIWSNWSFSACANMHVCGWIVLNVFNLLFQMILQYKNNKWLI